MSITKRKYQKKDKITKNGKVKKGGVTITYEVNISYTDAFGKQQRYCKGGFRTIQDARNHEADKRKELNDNGKIYASCKLTLNQVYDEFLVKGTSKYQVNTINNTRKYRHRLEKLGNVKLDCISFKMLQEHFDGLGKIQGFETNKALKKALNRVFEYAVDCEYIMVNPIKRVTVTGIERHMDYPNVLSYEDYVKLVNALQNSNGVNDKAYAMAITIGYYCGLRISETLALNKSDFNLLNDISYVSINKKIDYKGLKKEEIQVTTHLKSKASKADVPIKSSIVDDIRQYLSNNPYDIAICDNNGMYIHPDTLSNRCRSVAKSLGIEFHYHMLRHTLATNLAASGVDPKEAQMIMRHADIGTTMNVYTHVEKEKLSKAMEKLKEQ